MSLKSAEGGESGSGTRGINIYPTCVPLSVYDLRVKLNPSAFGRTIAREVYKTRV